MPTFKARVVAEATFIIEVEADDAFDAMDVATATARKFTPAQFAEKVTTGVVRYCSVEETVKKRKA